MFYPTPRISKAALAILLGLSLTANTFAATKKHPVTGDALAEKQVYEVNNQSEPPTLDPHLATDTTSGAITNDLFEGLVTKDKKGNIAPGVALSWKASNSNKTYTFKLRKNAKWSNGDKVTAHDFVYGWRRAVDPATASKYAAFVADAGVANAAAVTAGEKKVEQLGIRAIGDYTVEVKLDNPIPYFVSMTTQYTLMPGHKATIEKHGSAWTKPGNMVSNGAFKLKEWKINEKVIVERNEHYWDNDKNVLDQVVFHAINDLNAALNRYRAGELHQTPFPPAHRELLEKEIPKEVVTTPRLCTYMYQFNHASKTAKWIKDVRVRKGLALLINRDIIVKSITKGGQYPAFTLVHPFTGGYKNWEPEWASWSQKKREAEGLKLIKAAGYDKSKPLEINLIYNTNETHKQVATAATQMWKKAGIKVNLNNQEWKTYLDTVKAGNFEVARYAWCADYNEASTFLDFLRSNGGSNYGKWSNATFDKETSMAKSASNANKHYQAAEKAMANDTGVIPIYHYTRNLLLKPNVGNFPLDDAEGNVWHKDMYIKASK